ncbi:hypothetical protein QYE76_030481 [Lolium multiflorum]|uniref:Uncharacterized protein n=1 Tax=Lolium multiflorum TaxID=4521 RepID=A0AAD8QTD7_LOLMU|nr:hypothetical protein QYE76_030481 [Lolium multiflorum]
MTGNKCKIEASIAEAVLNVEVANFTTKHYDPNIPTKHNPVLRYNAANNEEVPKLSIFVGLGGKSSGSKPYRTDLQERTLIHSYVLNTMVEVKPYIEQFKAIHWKNTHREPTPEESKQIFDKGGGFDMASPINFNQFLEKEKLKSNGSNFTDWFRHVRIFLNGGNLQYVLDAPLGDPPAETETDEVKNVYAIRKTRYSQVQCAILCSLEADLQKRFEHHDPHELINELKTIFETHAAVECYEASKHFFRCMMEEGSSVSEHMLAMTGHAKKLNMNKELPELFAMLKSAEIEIKKEHQVLMVNKTTSFKKQGKSKGKNKKSGKKAATPCET